MEAGDKGNLEKKPLLSFNHLIFFFFRFFFTDSEISKGTKFSFNLLHKM